MAELLPWLEIKTVLVSYARVKNCALTPLHGRGASARAPRQYRFMSPGAPNLNGKFQNFPTRNWGPNEPGTCTRSAAMLPVLLCRSLLWMLPGGRVNISLISAKSQPAPLS